LEAKENSMNSCIIFSGILGALIGSLVTIILYLHSRHNSTKRALFDRLEFIRYDVYHGKSTATDAWENTLIDIWQLYNAFYDFAWPWQRCSVKKAWCEYKVINKDAEEKAQAQGITYISKTAPFDTDNLFYRIDTFLKVL
jgi:hypothetical protein